VAAASAYDAARGRLVLFGGVDRISGSNAQVLNDTWEYDGRRWVRMETPTAPEGRFWHAMAYDAARRRVVLFAGGNLVGRDQVFSDTWEWDGRRWTRGPDGPPGRVGHLLVAAPGGGLLMTGGAIAENQTAPDEWVYANGEWRQVRGPDPAAMQAAAERAVSTTRMRAYQAAMRSDLRNLAVSQESYFADHTTYTADIGALGYIATQGVTVEIRGATDRGWSAIATHARAPGVRCGIWVGNADKPMPEVTNEGAPVCVAENR